MTVSDLSAEKYVRLTSFTRDGRPKNTPVWAADLGDGRLGTTTDSDSWKVRRIARTPRVEITASDGRGDVEPHAVTVAGQADIVSSQDPRYSRMESALLSKYGLMYRVFRLIRRIRGKTPCGIVFTPDGAS